MIPQKFGNGYDKYIQHLYCLPMILHDMIPTLELYFHLVYGHFARIPTEKALSIIQTHYEVYIDDYKLEFVNIGTLHRGISM